MRFKVGEDMYKVGIDIGSSAAKAVVLDGEKIYKKMCGLFSHPIHADR